MLLKTFLPLKCQSLLQQTTFILFYIILADDSSCLFDVCVYVCVCVKCRLPKNSPGALRVQAFIAVIMFTLVTIYRNTVLPVDRSLKHQLSQLQQMTA